ncbi:hypothetical protein, partial [Litorivivens sp.]
LVQALEAALDAPQAQARRSLQLRAFSELLLNIELRQNWLVPFVQGTSGTAFFKALMQGEAQPADIVDAFRRQHHDN